MSDAAWFPSIGDVALRPRVRYKLTDSVAVWGGYDYFDGDPEEPLGRLRDNRVGFMGLEVSAATDR